MDAAFSSAWPPLLLLSDLYTRSLLAMGDDELFSIEYNTTTASRNQLTRIELIDFSKKLLNIAYALWSKEDQRVMEERAPGINLKWEDVRERVTICLQVIHARDSRNPFMPSDHWLVNSQIDMNAFTEAAVSEEQSQANYVSPRLGVLNNIPFTIPVDVRKSIFQRFVANDMVRDKSGKTRVSLRRGSIAQDAFDKLEGVDIKAPIEITIVDEIGQEEASDGVSEAFFSIFFHEVFNRDRGFWLANEKQELYPSPHATKRELSCRDVVQDSAVDYSMGRIEHDLKWYHFTGRMVGKAIYEGHFVGVSFAGFFLNKWFGKQESFLDDLQSLDYDLWQGLVKLKRCTDPQDLKNYSIYFSIDVEGKEPHDLIPNGSNIAVTRENRLQYIQLVSRYRLSEQIKLQTEAFFQGLLDVIDSRFFRMFSQQDVTDLLGSASLPIDLVDLRRHTEYEGLYHDAEASVTAFWTVVDSFDQDERRALLKFVTSCSRPPLLGFKDLVPNFTICDAGSDEQYLPTANKCHNLLKFPRYKSEQLLRNKLLQAIYAGCP
ncbi:hypothetical protein PILCRDRAFT_308371 [Piloderma croceum F 1598]|uniref:HECT-type E3 ubiquitin transferase n=1 Tax=Piloderma croceum (strain F 1598) TaxID=765440 RepID=A0A0C3G7A5_PILCF|nr:hypothetical protein PILCRDRAFT_308371 [Piloderma croceum F 1598]